jgi:SAM-dependent methyltransferase
VNGATICWACPACRSPLQRVGASQLECTAGCAVYEQRKDIWRLLAPEKETDYRAFVQNYDTVRLQEAWCSSDGAYYRALPYKDLSGRHPDVWRIRAISYDTMLVEVVHPMASTLNRTLHILDAGAGNGWLSYRLALEGHTLLATDLRVNDVDGLGACSWYMNEVNLVAAQAAFEQMPLCDDQFDLVVFAGCIHYATDYESTLREALRVLRHGGRLVILDSPLYKNEKSGQKMVQERDARLRDTYGIDPETLPHENYLTYGRLQQLGEQLGVTWSLIEPFYGWAWTLAPWFARLRRKREPARFFVIVGRARA